MKKEWQQNMDPANNQHQLKQTTCNENQKHCHVGQKDGWLDVASSNLSMLLLPVNCVQNNCLSLPMPFTDYI